MLVPGKPQIAGGYILIDEHMDHRYSRKPTAIYSPGDSQWWPYLSAGRRLLNSLFALNCQDFEAPKRNGHQHTQNSVEEKSCSSHYACVFCFSIITLDSSLVAQC